MAILAGDRDDACTTLEVQYDMLEDTDFIMLRKWREAEVEGEVLLLDGPVMRIPISDDLALRTKLVLDLAKVLGVLNVVAV